MARVECQAPHSVSVTELHRQNYTVCQATNKITYKIAFTFTTYKTSKREPPTLLITPLTWSGTTNQNGYQDPLINCYWVYRERHFLCLLKPLTSVLLQSGTHCRSVELFSIFRHNLETELTAYTTATANAQPGFRNHVRRIHLRHMVPYKCVLIDWLIDTYQTHASHITHSAFLILH